MKVPEKGNFDVYKIISNKRSLAQVKNESRVRDVPEQYNLCESCGFEVLVWPFFSSFKRSQLSLEPRSGRTDRQRVLESETNNQGLDLGVGGKGGENKRERSVDFCRSHRKLGISPDQKKKKHQTGQQAARPFCALYRAIMVSWDNSWPLWWKIGTRQYWLLAQLTLQTLSRGKVGVYVQQIRQI